MKRMFVTLTALLTMVPTTMLPQLMLLLLVTVHERPLRIDKNFPSWQNI